MRAEGRLSKFFQGIKARNEFVGLKPGQFFKNLDKLMTHRKKVRTDADYRSKFTAYIGGDKNHQPQTENPNKETNPEEFPNTTKPPKDKKTEEKKDEDRKTTDSELKAFLTDAKQFKKFEADSKEDAMKKLMEISHSDKPASRGVMAKILKDLGMGSKIDDKEFKAMIAPDMKAGDKPMVLALSDLNENGFKTDKKTGEKYFDAVIPMKTKILGREKVDWQNHKIAIKKDADSGFKFYSLDQSKL